MPVFPLFPTVRSIDSGHLPKTSETILYGMDDGIKKRKRKEDSSLYLKSASYVLKYLQVASKYSNLDCSLKYAVPTLRQLRGGQCRGRVATNKQANARLSLRSGICVCVIIRLSLGQRVSGLKSDPMMFCRIVLPPVSDTKPSKHKVKSKRGPGSPGRPVVGGGWSGVVGGGRGGEGGFLIPCH